MAEQHGSRVEQVLGIALIGCGGMASHYRNNYVGIPGTIYRLVVDVNAELAESVAKALGVERWSTYWQDALTDDIHIVDVSTPNHLHAEQAIAALQAGKHVIVQKPLAPTIAASRAIVEAAKTANRQAAVYMSDLEDAVVWDIRDLVQSGFLGRVTGVRARYAHRGGLSAKPNPNYWRGSAEKTGGGSFIQLSLHHTNLISWILNDRIASVMAYSKNLMCPNIGGDDMTASIVEFAESAVLGVFESAWNADGTALEIFGSEGSVKMRGGQGSETVVQTNHPFSGRVLCTTDTQATVIPASGGMNQHCRPDNPLNQHIAFVQAVRDNQPYPVTAEIGLYDVAVVKAVYQSAETGQRVPISTL